MASSVHIVGISGSLRKASTNTGLLRAAVKHLPANTTLDIVEIGDLPLFNEDLEANPPASVTTFKDKISKADAFLFASPENNYSVSASLKNAIDWASRSPKNIWAGKPAAVMGSGGGAGTARAQLHLRQIAVFVDLKFVTKPEVGILRFAPPTKFDEKGDLTDAASDERVKALVNSLVDYTVQLKK